MTAQPSSAEEIGRPSSCRPGRETDPADPSGADARQQPPSAEEIADPAAADPDEETDPADPSGADDGTAAIRTGDRRPSSCRPDEESPTQRIPRVQMTTQAGDGRPSSCRPSALDAQKFDGEDALAEVQPDGAQDYRTRVEVAELPDDVRKAALGEVDKLERTSDQSPDSSEIRIWLDTILDLPWSAKTTDWIDIQGSREVEATLRRLIEPAAGDVEGGDSAEVEAVPVDVEGGDSAEVEAVPVDVEEGDTAEVEAVPVRCRGGRHRGG